MKYCSKCGAELADDAVVCTKCGCAVENTAQQPQQQTTATPAKEGKVLGILAIIFGALGGILGLILSIIGICTYKQPANRRNCYIGLALFVVWVVIYIVYYAVSANQTGIA